MKPCQLPAQEPDGLFKTPLSRFLDMNNDGFEDIVVTNGFITQDDTSDL